MAGDPHGEGHPTTGRSLKNEKKFLQRTPPGSSDRLRPLKNAQFCSSSRKAKILTTGIHLVFRGLKFEPDVPPLAGGKRERFANVAATPDRDGANSGDQLRRKAAITFTFHKKIWLRSKKVFRFH
jgi:hypothetical protein